jgi:hypothetical protein
MTTHMVGQAQSVADRIPANQGDGAAESPNSQRIRESAYRVAGIALHSTRWVEGVLRHVNGKIETISERDFDTLVQKALVVVDALPATELDEIAQKAGL